MPGTRVHPHGVLRPGPRDDVVAAIEAVVYVAARHAVDGIGPRGCKTLYTAIAGFARRWLNRLQAKDAYGRPARETQPIGQNVWDAWSAIQRAVAELQRPVALPHLETAAELHKQGVSAHQIARMHAITVHEAIAATETGRLPTYYTSPAEAEHEKRIAERFASFDADDVAELASMLRIARRRIDAEN